MATKNTSAKSRTKKQAKEAPVLAQLDTHEMLDAKRLAECVNDALISVPWNKQNRFINDFFVRLDYGTECITDEGTARDFVDAMSRAKVIDANKKSARSPLEVLCREAAQILGWKVVTPEDELKAAAKKPAAKKPAAKKANAKSDAKANAKADAKVPPSVAPSAPSL